MPQDRYQTVQEIADRLQVSEATVLRQWIREGALRASDIGKGWRVSDADLDDFLRRHETLPRQNGLTAFSTASEIRPVDHSDRREH